MPNTEVGILIIYQDFRDEKEEKSPSRIGVSEEDEGLERVLASGDPEKATCGKCCRATGEGETWAYYPWRLISNHF